MAKRPPQCSKTTVRCHAAGDPSKPTPECCKQHLREILGDVLALFNAHGVPYFIDYGSLLGYLLNGGIYPNDYDVDICTMVEYRDIVRSTFVPELQAKGWYCKYFPAKHKKWDWGDALQIQVSMRNRLNIDITFWALREDGILTRSSWSKADQYKGREMPLNWIIPTHTGTFEGMEVQVPKEAEKLIAFRYGPNWRNLPASKHDNTPR